jgi:hypothetical protein
MPKYKNIRVNKKGGGTRLQRVMVKANGQYKFVKNKKTTKKRSKSTKKKTTTRKRSVSKKSTGGRRTSRRMNITIPIGGIAIGLSTIQQLNGFDAAQAAMNGDIMGAGRVLAQNSVADIFAAGIPIAVYGFAKKAIGNQTIFQIGKVRVTL